jgi:hypothetical protein
MIKTTIKTGFPELFLYLGRSLFSCLLLLSVLLLEAQLYDKERLITVKDGAEIYSPDTLIISESSRAEKIKIYASKNTKVHGWNDVEIVRLASPDTLKNEKQFYAAKSPSKRKDSKVTDEKIIKKTVEISVFPVKRHSVISGDLKYQPYTSSSNINRLKKKAIIDTKQLLHNTNLCLFYKKGHPRILEGFSTNIQGFGKVYRTRPPPIRYCFH